MANFPITTYWFPIAYGEAGFKTDISEGFGGKEWRDSVVSVSRRTFNLPLNMLTLAQIKTVWDFYVARKGAYESFNITVRDENGNNTVFLVRFQKDGLTYDWFKKAQWHKSGALQVIEDK